MDFIVYGRDGAVFDYGPNSLHEAHQVFMDSWASHLVARGPTLSPDGEMHTGSVHVIDVPDEKAARLFSLDEPYTRAGWYSETLIWRLGRCVDGKMWDRPAPPPGQPAAFVLATWEPLPAEGLVRAIRSELAGANGVPWLFGGVLLDDNGMRAVGLVVAADLTPQEADAHVRNTLTLVPALTAYDVQSQRWRRGGRPPP